MFSKSTHSNVWTFHFHFLVSAFSLIWNLSCAQEEPLSNVKTLDVGAQKAESIQSELFCLSEISNYIVNYFGGRLKKKELEEFWDCTAKAIQVFQKYAKPDAQGHYPAEHVRHFLTEYFWPREHFSNELLHELMFLKQVLFGGDSDRFTKEDFSNIENFLIQDMKNLTSRLVDEIHLLTSGTLHPKKTDVKAKDLERAIFHFRKVMKEFGTAFSRQGYAYPFLRIEKLMSNLKPMLVAESGEGSLFQDLENFIPIIRETKVLLVGPDRTQILASEWSDFFVLIANAFSIWLRSENFIAGEDLTEGEALAQFHILFDEVLTYIHAGLSKRLVQVYSHQEARLWLEAMNRIFEIPFGLNLALVERYWSWLTDKILVPDLEKASTIAGLTPAKVALLKERFAFWYNTQVRINQTWGNSFDANDPRLGAFQRVFRGLSMNLSFDSFGRVVIPRTDSAYDRLSLTYLNFESSAVDLVIRAYAQDSLRRQETSSLTVDEVKQLLADLHEMFVFFNFIDAEDTSFYKRFYRDTSLFVPQANGDELIDFGEIVSFLHFVSSGYQSVRVLDVQGLDRCSLPVTLDSSIKKNADIEVSTVAKLYIHSCFKNHLASQLPHFLGHLPQLQNYLEFALKQDLTKYHDLIDNLMLTVSKNLSYSGSFTNGELLKFQILLQYIETYMHRFDLNGDSYMDPMEVSLFLDNYLTPIASLLGQNQESLENFIRSFFTYIIKYHKSPLDTGNHGGSLRFHLWSRLHQNWQFNGDRLDLSYVLRILGGF